MSLDRRTFLRRLVLGGAAFTVANTLDRDFWSWVPGATGFVDAPRVELAALDEVSAAAARYFYPGVIDTYFKSQPLMAYLKSRMSIRWTGKTIGYANVEEYRRINKRPEPSAQYYWDIHGYEGDA